MVRKVKQLKGWQRGAIFGGIVGLVFIIIILFVEGIIIEGISYERLPEFLILMFLFYFLSPIVLGAFIGFLGSLIKTKNKPIVLGGIAGLMVGIFSVLLLEIRMGKFFMYPLLIFGIILDKSFVSFELEGLVPFFIFIHMFLWSLIGLVFGFIIYLIKKDGER